MVEKSSQPAQRQRSCAKRPPCRFPPTVSTSHSCLPAFVAQTASGTPWLSLPPALSRSRGDPTVRPRTRNSRACSPSGRGYDTPGRADQRPKSLWRPAPNSKPIPMSGDSPSVLGPGRTYQESAAKPGSQGQLWQVGHPLRTEGSVVPHYVDVAAGAEPLLAPEGRLVVSAEDRQCGDDLALQHQIEGWFRGKFPARRRTPNGCRCSSPRESPPRSGPASPASGPLPNPAPARSRRSLPTVPVQSSQPHR